MDTCDFCYALSSRDKKRRVHARGKDMKKWTVLESELAFDTRWAKVRRDTVDLGDGRIMDDYYYWEGADFAMVFALTPDQDVIVVEQYKHGVKTIVTELPAGMIETSDADPAEAAQRELLEETGYRVEQITALGVLDVSAAKSTVRAYAYLATGAHKTDDQNLDSTEAIRVTAVPLADWLTMIAQGRVTDVTSIATTLKALQALDFLNK